MIAASDITVVVQGPWHDDQTPECLASIARVLPGAEVILSVWKAPPAFAAHDAAADAVLLNRDPGAIDIKGVLSPEVERRTNIALSNFNRQLVSTRNGLALAQRPYALKLRTDMVLEHAGFLTHFDAFRGIGGPLRAFAERIVTTNARSPRRSFCMFVQDFCSFGRTDDMRTLWTAPPFPSREELLAMPMAEREARVLAPEQQLVLSALRTRHDVAMENALDATPELVDQSEQAIAGNFVCLDPRRYGVRTLKPSLAWVNEPGDIRLSWLWMLKASYAEFLSWCRRHCGAAIDPLIAACPEYEAEMVDLGRKATLITAGRDLDPNALFLEAQRAHNNGRLEEAQNGYVTLLRANVKHPQIYHLFGVLQLQRGEVELGVATLEQAAHSAPEFLPSCEALAAHFQAAGDAGAAALWRGEAERRRAPSRR
ncbi:WavE lipopolysaccharide synthesis family protein [Azospirillum sp.]|uniref:WavE lipopolysaccharide synthesis family protein n=1 Tax=Azospirillum sp. TaxID=34012 RepID=UPI003D71C3C5